MKQDEIDFFIWIQSYEGRIPSDFWHSLTKRQYYILDKWAHKGYWEYGVSLRSGWFTSKGKEELAKKETGR